MLATQTLLARKAKNMRVQVDGQLGRGCSAKDIVLAIIGKIGTAGGTGYTIEFAGSAIRALSMEGRMTVCNMAIEAGARAGLIAVDETTIAYLRGRPFSPSGLEWALAEAYWRTLRSDADAHWDAVVTLDAARSPPADHLGHVARNGRRGRRARSRSGKRARPRAARRDGARAALHGARRRTCPSPTSGSTRSSSARAPTPGSRTCAKPPRSCASSARASRATSGWRWSFPVPAW